MAGAVDDIPRAVKTAVDKFAQERNPSSTPWGEPDVSLLATRRPDDLPKLPVHCCRPLSRDGCRIAARGACVTATHVAVPLLIIAAGLSERHGEQRQRRAGTNRWLCGAQL